jgi:aminomethyltransferase
MSVADGLKILPLEDMHRAAGARFCGFAGWSMPLTYPPGVMKEHLHTREAAGLFDISHMKLIAMRGPEAARMLARACPLDPAAMEDGQSKYTFLLDEKAGILDDLIVNRLAADSFIVVANAGNADADTARFKDIAGGFDCTVEPLERVFLALQGPAVAALMPSLGLGIEKLSFMTCAEPKPGWFVSRSGYTGEDGFEVAIPLDEAQAFAEKLLAMDGVEWIGLAARDSLRLEAGLCLHGNDITPDIDPATAGLMWAIPKPLRENGTFLGADALRAIAAAGPGEKRVGLKPEGRQPIRAGTMIYESDGDPVGRVTSGGFGPSAGHPVAMGYVSRDALAREVPLWADVRGTRIPVDIHPLPFTPHRYRKG